MSNSRLDRRRFIKKSAAAVGAFTIVPRHVLGGTGYCAPSQMLTRAVIGVGGMGRGHLRYLRDKTRLLAVCDVDAEHLKQALKIAGPDAKGYRDFREVLARDDIDMVHIPTPPHWHALISIAAAEAGKDIWCEKPMTRTIAEGEAVVAAVQRNARIFRINTWFRFRSTFYGFGTTTRPIRKAVAAGVFGWPLTVTINAATGFAWKLNWSGLPEAKPEPVPPELDYDMWLGPAPYKPYHHHRVHRTFRGYWDYDGGGLGDMGQHYIDPVQYILGKDRESPVFVEADTPQQSPEAVLPWRRIEISYADGCKLVLDGENRDKDAPFIAGPEGKLFRGFRSDIPDLRRKVDRLPDPEPQVTDFYQAVIDRRKFALNEANAHRSCTIVNLAKIAVRLQRPLHFDPETQRFIDDQAANRYVAQPMRGPWRI